jgi:hypothetical protein
VVSLLYDCDYSTVATSVGIRIENFYTNSNPVTTDKCNRSHSNIPHWVTFVVAEVLVLCWLCTC